MDMDMDLELLGWALYGVAMTLLGVYLTRGK